MEEKVYFDNGSGTNLCGMLYEGKGGTAVIIAHGHTESKDSKTSRTLSSYLIDKGVACLRLDLYGHGESGGRLDDFSIAEGTEDIRQAVTLLRSRGYERFILFGRSRGGVCILRASGSADSCVMVCPGSKDENYEELYSIAEGIRIPCLIVQGSADELVEADLNRRLSSIMGCSYEEIEGADHAFSEPLHFYQMIDIVTRYILEIR